MSLPRGQYIYEMEDPDFVIELGPDATGLLQEIRITNMHTRRWVSQAFYPETRDGAKVNLVLRIIELLWGQLALRPSTPKQN